MSDHFEPPDPYQSEQRNPYGPPAGGPAFQHYGFSGRPHRGVLVLTLGILGIITVVVGWLACPIIPVFGLALSIPAWVMGRNDVRAIDAGQMDPQGRSLEMSGMITGIIGTILGGLATLVTLAIIAFFAFVVLTGGQ